ncbi:LANO_0D10616g1_1 [Lachancea nothofagi CBS 11611]|uniref:LANO_0D10616g1_1 n=1 Tax=Lachancea nothofagi CBS 11611 TaxID=1266666 RepID=A0A1G4JKZ0_9SACH|nr:LANO_0D10616g1_1 [Lachancea nothofagi CBS 11611]
MTKTHKAVVLQRKGEIKIEDRPIPEIEDPHYVKLQIKKTGICGSDIHYYLTGAIGDFVLEQPMVLGHESSGIVVEVGEKVTRVKVGDRVAIEPGVPSRYSDATKAGRYNLCPKMAFAATPPYDGTLVKYYLAPEDFVVKLPDHVSLEEGALVEPLSVGVHANKLAKVAYNQKVVVFGAGPVGLLTGSVAKAFGAFKVVYVDISPEKLKLSSSFGGTGVVNSSEAKSDDQLVAEIEKALEGDQPEVVFDCSGAEICIRSGIKVCKSGGTYVQVGTGKEDVNFPIAAIGPKELKVLGCFRYAFGDYRDAVHLISCGDVDVKPLVTHRFKFSEAVDAYNFNAKSGANAIKTIIDGPE